LSRITAPLIQRLHYAVYDACGRFTSMFPKRKRQSILAEFFMVLV
jgi:hypothetical protein